MRLATALLLMATLPAAATAQAFQLDEDYARFGPHETVALARVEGDPSRVQVNAYGDAPVVRFIMDVDGVRRCQDALAKLRKATVAAGSEASARCPALSGAGVMNVSSQRTGEFEVEFSNAAPGNVVALTLDAAGMDKAIAAFKAAAGG